MTRISRQEFVSGTLAATAGLARWHATGSGQVLSGGWDADGVSC